MKKYTKFGKYLNELMIKNNLKPKELAEKSGVSIHMIYKIRKNKKRLTPENARKLCVFLSVDPVCLIWEQNKYDSRK